MDPTRRQTLRFVTAAGSGGFLALSGCSTVRDATGVGGETGPDDDGTESTDAAPEIDRSSFVLLEGTDFETTVYAIETGIDGPTAVVLGGVHGDEPSGARAAHEIRTWSPARGTLVVLPEANRRALEREQRSWPAGHNLNRQFPQGEDPSSELGTAIWERVVLESDPELLIDLHSSRGVLARSDGVGQTIFHSQQDRVIDAVEDASRTLTDRFIDGEYDAVYTFVRAPIDRETKTVTNKAAVDLETPVCLFESTRDGVPLEERVRWASTFAAHVLTDRGLFDERPR